MRISNGLRGQVSRIKASGSPRHEWLQRAGVQPSLTLLVKAHPNEVLPVFYTQSYNFSSATRQNPKSFLLSALGLSALYFFISINHDF